MNSLSQLAFVLGEYPFTGHAQARLVISSLWNLEL